MTLRVKAALLLAFVLGGGMIFALRTVELWAAAPGAPRDIGWTETVTLPAEAPLRLVVLGTSLTARYDWPDALATRLGACLTHPVEVIAIARGGATSAWGMTQRAALAEATPDLVLIEFAANDSDLRRRIRLDRSRDNHRALIAAARAANPEAAIALMLMNPVYGPRRLMRPRLPAYEALYADLARTQDTAVIDLAPAWRTAMSARRRTALPDGLHPEAEIAQAVIVPVISARLASHFGATCAQP